MKELLEIYIVFLKIGGLTFGGGYAMMPLLQKEVVESKHWASMEEIMDWYALGQCLPGIIMINTAVFVGHKKRGIAGAIAAALGAVTPSLIIICIIATILKTVESIPVVVKAFSGIRVCVCVLVLNAVVTLWKKAIIDKATFLIFIIAAVLSYFSIISPVIIVLAATVVGILLKVVKKSNADT